MCSESIGLWKVHTPRRHRRVPKVYGGTDLKGREIALQLNGPHLSLVGNMLKDAGLAPTDVTLRFVREITAPPGWKSDGPAKDPANALRRDTKLAGAAMIYPDILATTAGGTVGTGQEGTVKDARPVFSTKTANNVIFDVYAVRRDFLAAHPEIVEAFRATHLAKQEEFLGELANVAKRSNANRRELDAFKSLARPLAKIFLQDEGAVNDYILWLGVDSQLSGKAGNLRFFDDANAVGFRATTNRIQEFLLVLGLISAPSMVAFLPPEGDAAAKPAPAKQAFANTQAVRAAAESAGAQALYSYAFQFPAATSEINWRDYPEVFKTIHE